MNNPNTRIEMAKEDSNNDASLMRLADIRKSITEHLTNHSYNWSLENESLTIILKGDTYIISLLPKNTDCITLRVTYPIEPHAGAFLQSEKCQELYVDVLASRYPNISATLNPVENVLLLEYEADICSIEEFDHHFKDAISEIGFVLEFYMQRLEHVFKVRFSQR